MLAARREAERRLAQLAADLEREESHLAEAQASLTRLSEEQDAVTRAEAEDGPGRELAEAGLREAGACLAEAEAVLQRETEAVAAADARRITLERRRKELEERRARLEARRAEAERQRAGLAAALVAPEAVTAAAAAVTEAEARVEQCRAIVEAAEVEIANRLAGEQTALDLARQTDTRLARLTAEAEGLRRLLAPPPDTGDAPPILTALRVAPGFEAAIGAAFGDELQAPLANGESGRRRPLLDRSRRRRAWLRCLARGRPPVGRSRRRSVCSRAQPRAGGLGRERGDRAPPPAEPGAGPAARGPRGSSVALGRVRLARLRSVPRRRAFAASQPPWPCWRARSPP